MTFQELPVGALFRGQYLSRDAVGSVYRKVGEGNGWNAVCILSGALAHFQPHQEVKPNGRNETVDDQD